MDLEDALAVESVVGQLGVEGCLLMAKELHVLLVVGRVSVRKRLFAFVQLDLGAFVVHQVVHRVLVTHLANLLV